jgi:hypothetical protein
MKNTNWICTLIIILGFPLISMSQWLSLPPNTYTFDNIAIGTTSTLSKLEIQTNTGGLNNEFLINRIPLVGGGTPYVVQQPYIKVINNTSTKFLLNHKGFLGINTEDAETYLDIRIPTSTNIKSAIFGTKTTPLNYSSKQIFLVNRLANGGFNPISKLNDNGIFFTDGQNIVTAPVGEMCSDDEGVPIECPPTYENGSGGLVIGPWNSKSITPLGLRIDGNGFIGVGISTPTAKLHVDNGDILLSLNSVNNIKLTKEGLIRAREIKVDLNTIPDYVFDSNYNLMSLAELELYITSNHHLPGVPSSQEYTSRGSIDIGELQLKLLEKIEELTLYIIQIKKENEELKKTLNKQ